jgi:sortase A
MKFLKNVNWFLVAGVLLLLVAAGRIGWTYAKPVSPYDLLVTSPEELDRNAEFIPLVEPSQPGTDLLAPTLDPAETAASPAADQGAVDSSLAGSPAEQGYEPDRLVIPAIQLDAAVVPIEYRQYGIYDKIYYQWAVPDYFAAGWHSTSALLGVPGNTVLNGHHNAHGMVFKDLMRLEVGDTIYVYSGERVFEYSVVEKLLLPERYQSIETRAENARWIMPSDDERLTLITCWPADSNTHRVVIVAFPLL